ncbi:hypothetical protein DEU56DRAFT_902008 [Suillus clintonianus]|uniref:uncharacterized protein n=1 Tax=Suillus clintonianus TaxID=1904413 RepID=UPI001B867621|nr:uncharacterized protein DEU56DRAFT_902008 [Suillus clintonianus]KAG2134476.1 hypothetical protein DEU56DRAFT_902008 [Suillus clintonianus]
MACERNYIDVFPKCLFQASTDISFYTQRPHPIKTSCPPHLHIVKRMDHELKSKTEFLSLAEELQCYILSFLPCRDILRCTSVCKALRQTYMSSYELQYIVELGGQQLLPVPNTDDHTPISERLQLLRDKAHAWFKVNFHSLETVSLWEKMHSPQINDGHIYTHDTRKGLVEIIPILPKPSQQTVQRDRWQRTLSSITSTPRSVVCNVFMDLAQNLIAVLHCVDQAFYIDLGALDGDGVHPRAAGRRLSRTVLPGSGDISSNRYRANMKCFGRHIAFHWRSPSEVMWLQIWDWKNSMTSNCILNDNDAYPGNFFFLGSNRLLVVYHESDLNIYSIEDTSQAPQLLACFSMPISLKHTRLHLMDYNGHNSQPRMQIQQTMYMSDPKYWLLCITVYENLGTRAGPVFIISTRVFHDFDGMAVANLKPIPWTRWGPSNTRIFDAEHTQAYVFTSQLCGNRFFQAIPLSTGHRYRLHMMDFSPLAVTNRRGLGRVVTEPSTRDISELSGRPKESLTTFLPYVEVKLDRVFHYEELRVWVDKDRIYLAQMFDTGPCLWESTLEVIDV